MTIPRARYTYVRKSGNYIILVIAINIVYLNNILSSYYNLNDVSSIIDCEKAKGIEVTFESTADNRGLL